MANIVAISDSSSSNDSDDDMMPWEDDDFIPKTKSGYQKSPKVIRGELQRYIDACKTKGITQTSILEDMSVNSNSFRKFMNPKTYKGTWSGTQNSTYWAAGRLLERVKYEKEQAKKEEAKNRSGKKTAGTAATTTGKRKANNTSTSTSASTISVGEPDIKKTKIEIKAQAEALINRITAVPNVSVEDGVYDTCPQIVTKIKNFLQREGMTKQLLLKSGFGNINSNALSRFLAAKKQDQCGNQVYRTAYVFFEQLRILEGQSKSKARLKNEEEEPNGFSIEAPKPRYVIISK